MITTIFKYKVKKRKGLMAGKVVEETGFYRTKSVTPVHAAYHSSAKFYNVTSYSGGKFYSHFCEGMPMPMVLGGKQFTPQP